MSKIYLIIAREYRAKVANKSFVVTTIMIPLIVAMMILMADLLADSPMNEPVLSLSEAESAQMIGVGTALIIYLSILLFGVQIMRSVMEEKQSRTVEILVGSISPFMLIAGKIIAILLLSITQIALWMLLSKMGLLLLPVSNVWAIEWYPFALETQLKLLIFIPLFYFGGFLLYCSLFSIIGALATPNTETNLWMIPLTLPIVFSLYIILSTEAFAPCLVRFSEFFPFTSPIVMSSQIALGIGWVSLFTSAILLWIAAAIAIWVGSKVYRSALLLYHNQISWRDIMRWLSKKN